MKLFVYGTLRRDYPLHDYIEDALGLPFQSGMAEPVFARTLGRLHFHDCMAFPVLLPDLVGLTVGEVYDLPFPDPVVESLIRMELSAGYDMDERRVTTDDGSTFPVWMFTWPHQGWHVGPAVPDNDWANVGYTIFDRRNNFDNNPQREEKLS